MSFRIPNRLRRSDHLNRDIEPDFPEIVARSNRAVANTVTLARSSSICAFPFFKACPQILESTLRSFVGDAESSPASLAVINNE